jgi:prepilin-type N-terminal cleavage/methylation domain-containing protein
MRRRAHGFTLLELIVSMVILGILSAVAMGKLNQPNVDAAWFPDQVRAVVRLAQKQAIAQRTRILVVISSTQVSLCYATTSTSFACAAAVSDLTTGNAVVLTAPSGISLSSTASPFAFNGLGQPSSAVTVTVGGSAIQVTAETGYVS